MHRTTLTAAFAGFAALVSSTAQAHVSIASGPAFAKTSQEVAFGVGHGCAGADTVRVQIDIPAGVTSVRPETSDFGQVDVETDAGGSVVSVTWTKADANVLDADTQYYKLLLRLKAPDQPFTKVYFPAHQTCRAKDGTETVVDWVGIDEAEDSMIEPAPTLYVLPPRFPGWNKFTVNTAVDDLKGFFGDAQIVWSGSKAYSINPATTELIAGTSGSSALTALVEGEQIWVRY
ncbi:MAG TPA: YcnI family protein [Polyangiaceae bacterium]|nr:YcnI family protein [Polyangiaceae bacterium]